MGFKITGEAEFPSTSEREGGYNWSNYESFVLGRYRARYSIREILTEVRFPIASKEHWSQSRLAYRVATFVSLSFVSISTSRYTLLNETPGILSIRIYSNPSPFSAVELCNDAWDRDRRVFSGVGERHRL